MRALLFLTMVCLVLAVLLETANSNAVKKDNKKGAVAAHGKGKDAHKGGASPAKGNKKIAKSPGKKDAKGKKDKKEKPAKKGKSKDKKPKKSSKSKDKKSPTKPSKAVKAASPKAEPAQNNEPSSAPAPEVEQDVMEADEELGGANGADSDDLAEGELLEDDANGDGEVDAIDADEEPME
ncbi:hypothetical protein niasHT_016226 [Heterodera trifolii]|uniref:Effector protein n=1 Tax=Heterodera trifolii TaxID=157864 RepID=A0ABD2L820_9BILA